MGIFIRKQGLIVIGEDQIVLNYHKILSLLQNYTYGVECPKLVMVTKDQPVDLVSRILNKIKYPILGENRVQEALEKIEVCGSNKAEWHFIGHLQRNKVKKILRKFSLIQSVDRLSLAREIEKRASQENIIVKCLLQIDICQDGSKFGFSPSLDILTDVLLEISSYRHLRIQGLMTIAPYVSSEDTRIYFRRMRTLYEKLMKYNDLPLNVEMKILSMGMSNDYVEALEEGSTMIRVGRSIFSEYD